MSSEIENALREILTSVAVEAASEAIRQYRIMDEDRMAKGYSDRFLLRSHEAAEQLAISTATLNRLTRSGELPCVRVGRTVRYSTEAISEWIRQRESTERPVPKSAAPAAVTIVNPVAKTRTSAKKKTAKAPVKPKQSRKTPKRKTSSVQKAARERKETTRVSPVDQILEELGVNRSDVPPLTNGDLMRIAESDIGTMHGWLYLGRPLPEAETQKLREHFSQYRRGE